MHADVAVLLLFIVLVFGVYKLLVVIQEFEPPARRDCARCRGREQEDDLILSVLRGPRRFVWRRYD